MNRLQEIYNVANNIAEETHQSDFFESFDLLIECAMDNSDISEGRAVELYERLEHYLKQLKQNMNEGSVVR